MAGGRGRRIGANNSVGEIAHAIHRLVDAMRPQQVVLPQPAPWPVNMDDFMRHKPAKFNCMATLDDADAWIRECEKIFHVLPYSDEQKLAYATFLLVSDAEYWWVGMQQQMETRRRKWAGRISRRDSWKSIFWIVLSMRRRLSSWPCSRAIWLCRLMLTDSSIWQGFTHRISQRNGIVRSLRGVCDMSCSWF